jgi:hypothetical protein
MELQGGLDIGVHNCGNKEERSERFLLACWGLEIAVVPKQVFTVYQNITKTNLQLLHFYNLNTIWQNKNLNIHDTID